MRVLTEGGQARIEIDVDELLFPRGVANATIVWKLSRSPGWKFKDTSIAAHTSAPTADKQTTSANEWRSQIRYQSSSAANYVVQNANSKPSTLYYKITLYRTSDESPLTLDPVIRNQGP